MADPECLFCDEIESESNLIIDNDLFKARWDGIPLAPGHAQILPKRHVQYFAQLSDAELDSMLCFVKNVINIIRQTDQLAAVYEQLIVTSNDLTRPHLQRALEQSQLLTSPPDGFNQGLNDGPTAGQTIPHFHYHVIPRWNGDVPNPRGGIRNIFPNDEYSQRKL